MGHEPGALVGNTERPVQLMGRDAFLAGRHEVKAQNPLRQRDMASLHDSAVGDGELALTVIALIQAGAMRLTLHTGDAINRSAVWAEGASGPPNALQMDAGGVLIVENRVGQVCGGGHWLISYLGFLSLGPHAVTL